MGGEDTLFNLRWDAQKQAILSSVSDIFREESFVDITIAVADGKIFKAHRLILAASSPYLKQALLTVPSEHAVLLLPQVSSADLANILKFIYEGEIKIHQKALKSFLQVSKLLKIKGMDFDTDEEISELTAPANNSTTAANGNSKRTSPEAAQMQIVESSKRIKLTTADTPSTSGSGSSAGTSPVATATAANLDNRDRDRDHEHIPSSTADFQVFATSSCGDRDRDDFDDNDDADGDVVKSESGAHLRDYDKELISLDDEEEDDLGVGDGDDFEGADDDGDGVHDHDDLDDDDDGEFPFQPEVSFQEGTWAPAHSSTSGSGSSLHQQLQQQHHSSLSSMDIRRLNGTGNGTGTGSAGGKKLKIGMDHTQGITEGILQRMMREPLKNASGGGSSMSISLNHGGQSGHHAHTHAHANRFSLPHGGGHGHSQLLSPYELHDNASSGGLRKTVKRYVQCTSCSKVLSSLSALKRHMEDVHCARIQGKCIICGRVYSSRNSLLTHVYSAHKKHHDYKAVARIIRESDFEQFANI